MTEHKLTRRALFSGAGASLASTALSLAIIPAAVGDESSAVDPSERYELAVAEFKAAAEALYPGIQDWTVSATEGGVLAFGRCPPKPVEYSGYGVYELRVGKTAPIVALAASESGAGYYWQPYWCKDGVDRFDGKVRFIKSANLIIKRKIKAFA